MMWGYGWNMGWFWLLGLLVLIGLVLLIVLSVRVFGGNASRNGPEQGERMTGPTRAHQILDERYARGELTTEQYQEQVRVLNEQHR